MRSYLVWEKVSDYVVRGLAATLPLSADGHIQLVVGEGAKTLGLRLPVAASDQLPANLLRELNFVIGGHGDRRVLDITTDSSPLFPAFYSFARGVAECMDDKGLSPLEAVEAALSQFAQLLSKRSLLTDEAILGLYGELHFLEALLAAYGPDAFDSWLGPLGERHDFRLGNQEIEAKSTRGSTRIHLINGMDQLSPTPGRHLHILSLLYQRAGAGAGRSLPALLLAVRTLLRPDARRLAKLEGHLGKLGYRDADHDFYQDHLEPAGKPLLVAVDASVPRITREVLSSGLEPAQIALLSRISYGVNLEGMGTDEGTAAFAAVLPGIKFRR